MKPESAFDLHAGRYDQWFDRKPSLFEAEVAALRRFVVAGGQSLEIGVGSGRFAEALGIRFGVDPSGPMLALAVLRGSRVVRGVAEALPFPDSAFDVVLLTTTVCVIEDLERAFHEIARVLRRGGRLVVGMIDGDSWLGRRYRALAGNNVFYAGARFRTVAEVAEQMDRASVKPIGYVQTLFPEDGEGAEQSRVAEDYGQGGFVVVCGEK